jgi:hypothetical protein
MTTFGQQQSMVECARSTVLAVISFLVVEAVVIHHGSAIALEIRRIR